MGVVMWRRGREEIHLQHLNEVATGSVSGKRCRNEVATGKRCRNEVATGSVVQPDERSDGMRQIKRDQNLGRRRVTKYWSISGCMLALFKKRTERKDGITERNPKIGTRGGRRRIGGEEMETINPQKEKVTSVPFVNRWVA
jgi:hypothetical protein